MREAINTVFFASERVKFELDEMPSIADILMSKFKSSMCELYQAPDFSTRVTEDHTAMQLQVNPTVIAALSVAPAAPAEKLAKLQRIADEFGAPFDKKEMEKELFMRYTRLPPATTPHSSATASAPSPPQTQPYTIVQASAAVPAPAASAPPVLSVPQPPPPSPPLPTTTATTPSPYSQPYIRQTTFPPAPRPQTTEAQQQQPPTRPSGGPPSAVTKSPSIVKDPWAPLPPNKVNLGIGFDDKLESVAQFMATKRSNSADTVSIHSAGPSQDLGPRMGSVNSAQQQQAADVVGGIAEGEEEPPSPPTAEPPSPPQTAVDDDRSMHAHEEVPGEDDLIARLNKLRNV